MLAKNVLERCGAGGLLLALVMLWTQIPAQAQEKTLRKQLEEARAAIEDQTWVIEQMKDNFFKITGQLEAELKQLRTTNTDLKATNADLKATNADLKATNAEQAQTIKQITDNFFKVTGELTATTDKQAATIKKLKGQRTLLGIGVLIAAVVAVSCK